MADCQSAVFVYGANLAGIHGKGAALTAKNKYGAQTGKIFLQNRSYGIPTKNEKIQTLPLSEIDKYVEVFFVHARHNPDKIFLVTPVGCGLAGYKPDQIAVMFEKRYTFECSNIILPQEFIEMLQENVKDIAEKHSNNFYK